MNVFVFPGQGSQKIGMGADLAQSSSAAKAVFEEVNDALSFNLLNLMTAGSADELNQTENTQPALMAHSLAVIKTIEAESGKKLSNFAHFVAGHSLGEYSALAAIDAISITDTAKLLRLRGLAMQRAVPEGLGSMAAILGLEFDQVHEITHKASTTENIVVAANDNGGGQVVISGHKDAVEKASKLAKEAGAKRVLPLPVSVPSHSPLMQPAADEMQKALSEISFQTFDIPIIPNVLAQATLDTDKIADLLVKQLIGTVRWRESMIYLAEEKNVTSLIEAGTGKVLCGMNKRIAPNVQTFNLSTMDEILTFLEQNT